jgi:hypothetical protein
MYRFSPQRRTGGPKRLFTQRSLQYDLDVESAPYVALAELQRFCGAARLDERERRGMLWQIAN